MTRGERRSLSRLSAAAYGSICVALALVILLGIWGAYRDMRAVRHRALRTEMASMRSHAVRTVGRMEWTLGQQETRGQRERLPDLTAIRQDDWIRQFWQRVMPVEQGRLYAAVVKPSGEVLMHTDPRLEGRYLEENWHEGRVPGFQGEVVETRSKTLSGGKRAYDIRMAITVRGERVGTYHAGLSVDWFRGEHASVARRQIARRWAVVIGGISIVVLLAGVSLYYIAYRSAALRNTVSMMQVQRVTELGQVAAGLAHEIRNPLHAIRLNLHALRRMRNAGKQRFSPGQSDEITTIIDQSNDEISRLDRLIQELLGYAKPDEAWDEDMDVVAELKSTLGFVREEMQSSKVDLIPRLPEERAIVHMDPTRFRQILLNLLVNAKEAVGAGGRIEVGLTRRDEFYQVRVSDDGPGINEEDRGRIFDPFYTTKHGGTGLGLALVKRFVDEAGGRILCEASGGGTTFRILLPASSSKR